jgi:hypothetical protein
LVTITHPYHPLRGQQVEVICVRRGTDPDLVIRLPDGLHAAIAMSSTDYAVPPDLDPPSVPPHLLDFDGLRQVVQLIEHIRQEGRYSAADDGDKTCTPDDVSYD